MYDFVRGIKMEDTVEGTRFDPVLSLLDVSLSNKLKWAFDGYLGWYHYELRTCVARSVPAYWRHQEGFSNLSPVSRAGVPAWKIRKAAEVLERARQRPVVQR